MKTLDFIKRSVTSKLIALKQDNFDVVVSNSEYGIIVEVYSFCFGCSVISSL